MSSETPVTPARGKYGHAIGKYEIVAHIATGGMGAVYRAVNSETGEEAALKVLSPALAAKGGTALERFKREGRIHLRHENVVAIYEIGEANNIHYLALEFVDGIDLHEYSLRRGPLDADEARSLLTQAARALDYLHSHQMVHRDVKPSNFLLTYRDDEPVLKLTDMGLARDVNDAEGRVTQAGNTVGTIDYMAPEQARDSGLADIRSDLYALGCTFYHLLAGQPPFPDGGLAEKLYKHAESEPPDVRTFNPQVPTGLTWILKRMMAKKPHDRYQAPSDLLDDLTRLERGEPVALSGRASETNREGGMPHRTPPSPLAPHHHSVSPDQDSPLSPSVTTQQSQLAKRHFEQAQQTLAHGHREYALELLLDSCKLDPARLPYRQALRLAQRTIHQDIREVGRLDWLTGLFIRTALTVARQAGRPLKVLEYGEKLLTRNPWDIEVQIDMAEAAEQLGLTSLALWILEQAWSKEMHTPALDRALARLYERRGLYAEAAKLWKLVLRVDPDEPEAHRKVNDLAAKETIARGLYEEMVESRTGRERS
jgi:serine/threonine protein kinase